MVATPKGFSASVRIWLRYGDHLIPLSHCASTFVIAAQPVDLPAGEAQIVLEVDGTRFERPVTLPGGMRIDTLETPVTARDGCAPF